MKIRTEYELNTRACGSIDGLSLIGALTIHEDELLKLKVKTGLDAYTTISRYGFGWAKIKNYLRVIEGSDPIMVYEPFTSEIFYSECTGKRLLVDTAYYNKSGQLAVYIQSEMCGLRLKEGEVVDITEYFDRSLLEKPLLKYDFGKLNSDISYTVFEHIVRLSDLDRQHHMNNVKYTEIAFDAFKESEISTSPVKSAKMLYMAQAHENDVLLVQRENNDVAIRHTDGRIASLLHIDR